MKLLELLKNVEIVSKKDRHMDLDVKNMENIEIKKIAYHSNEVTPDTLFVCIKGYQTDGHDYAKVAVQKGAKAIIVERYLAEIDIPQIKVKDSRKSLACIAADFFNQPSKALSVFGVTGTNGKTTITYMVDSLFEGYGLNTGLIGTVMIKIKDRIKESMLTTPESADLQMYLRDMKNEGVSHVAMEVSSSALDLERVSQTQFDIVAFTNINHDHIDLHGSFQSYFDAKASLIRNASKKSIALLNCDEPLLLPLIHQTEAEVVTFGINNTSGTVQVSDIDLSSGKPSFTVNIKQPLRTLTGNVVKPTSFTIDLKIPGYHSIYNATTAILTGLLNDLPLEYIKTEMAKFKGVERRFHILYDKEFTVIDDLLLNENNVNSCMRTVEKLDFKTLHVVHAIRGNNGTELNKKNAAALAKWFLKMETTSIVLTTSTTHVKEKDCVSKEELKTFLDVMEQAQIKVELFEGLQHALARGLEKLKHGDLLLISGARGMDHGAKITLELMKKHYPYVDHNAISDVLSDKVVGMRTLNV